MRAAAGYRETRFEKITRIIGLIVLAPLLAALSLPVAVHIARKPDFGFLVHQMRVVSVAPDGPAARAHLQTDDLILGVDNLLVERMANYHAAMAGNYDLRPVSLLVERGAGQWVVKVSPRAVSQSDMIRSYSLWAAGLAFLLIGWWVLSRRRDPVARNFFALCIVFAFFLSDVPDVGWTPYMIAQAHLRTLLQLLMPAYVLRFFLQFPSLRRNTAGEPTRLRMLLIPSWILFLASSLLEWLGTTPSGSGSQILDVISLIYMLSYFVFGLVHFGRRTLRRDRPIQRTKMRVILLGLAAGLVPFLIAMLAGTVAPGTSPPHLQYLALSLLLVPTSFALAILRYGALDTAFVVRISLIYGALTLSIVLGYVLLVVLLGRVLTSLFSISSTPLLLAITACSGLAVMPLRRRLQRGVDLAFYPARRANRRAMADLADRLTGLIEAEKVIAMLQDTLMELFRPRHLVLYLRRDADAQMFAPRDVRARPGTPSPDPAPLPGDSGLATLLNRLRRPVFSEEVEDLLLAGDTDSESLTALTRLRESLLVPLVTGDRLLGFMVFGPKPGGALYGQEDLENLKGLAVQGASLIDSRRLYAASLRRRQLETELEVAHGIQAQLLPTAPLEAPEFSICGKNEPCRGVGGDYFDYFQRNDGTLALAIGDVAGKGIPAALLMTSLRVAFRQEAAMGVAPRDVMQRLNGVVAGLVGSGSFICFFFAVWDPEDGLLRYCNAGMDPPVLYRPATGYRQSLKLGGPVLGVEPDSVYREGALPLAPGDRLFMYSDGLPDQRGPKGEFFDSTRLLGVIADSGDVSPQAALDTVFARVNAFGGDVRSDDKTAILLEIKKLKKN